MCMDVIVPGQCINVEFYSEQVWVKRREDVPDALSFDEIYDLCLCNPQGSPPVESLWLLFPHDYTRKYSTNRAYEIKTWPMNVSLWTAQAQRNWPYVCAPDHSDSGTRATWHYFSEPPHLRGQRHRSLEGAVLYCDKEGVGSPLRLEERHIDLLTGPEITKTLVCAKLERPLRPGDRGWIRIVANPQNLDGLPCRAISYPNIPHPFEYEQRSNISCPLLVRDMLFIKLEEFEKDASDPELTAACEHIRNVVCVDGIYRPGTATRIADHRLALIAEEGIEICDTACTGHIKLLGRIPHLEKTGYSTILWGGGSNRNRDVDLVHNVQRIRDMIRHNGPKSKAELAIALAPSGTHEAFCVLIDNMVKTGILTPGALGTLELHHDLTASEGDLQDFALLTLLRNLYSPASHEHRLELLGEFADLHPWKIDFRLKWFPRESDFGSWISPMVEDLNAKHNKQKKQPKHDDVRTSEDQVL